MSTRQAADKSKSVEDASPKSITLPPALHWSGCRLTTVLWQQPSSQVRPISPVRSWDDGCKSMMPKCVAI